MMVEKIKKFHEYLDYIEEHYTNVQIAWALINKKCRGNHFRFMYDDFVWHTIAAAVKDHDLSKLSAEEFTQYRQFFFPCEGEKKDKDLFVRAWAHHKKKNSHHWENWTKNQADDHYADAYLVLMVIDWVAMGFKCGDTAQEYYEKNKGEMKLPKWAIKLMYEIFSCVYQNQQ